MLILGHRKNIGKSNYAHGPQTEFKKQGFI